MKKTKTEKNKALNFYTTKEVFKKASKSKKFRESYSEELMRLRLARQIRELRLKEKLTQASVAKKANMPQSVIARIESGEHSFTLGTLNRIAKVFDKEIQLS